MELARANDMFVNWSYKLTKLSFQISNMTHLILCLWKLELIPGQHVQYHLPLAKGTLVGTTKLINPIRGGTCLEIIPLHVIILVVLIEVNSKPVVRPSLVVDSRLESLEFLPTTIPFPHLKYVQV
jgi:hypothetical protein